MDLNKDVEEKGEYFPHTSSFTLPFSLPLHPSPPSSSSYRERLVKDTHESHSVSSGDPSEDSMRVSSESESRTYPPKSRKSPSPRKPEKCQKTRFSRFRTLPEISKKRIQNRIRKIAKRGAQKYPPPVLFPREGFLLRIVLFLRCKEPYFCEKMRFLHIFGDPEKPGFLIKKSHFFGDFRDPKNAKNRVFGGYPPPFPA